MQRPRKHSHKRDAILACVRSTDTHPTADWVFSQLKPVIPDLSLGTVYRNLAMFKQEGIIQSVGVVNGLERFDRTVTPHCHFVCTCCGRVLDVPSASLPEALIDAAEAELQGKVMTWNLQFTGLCKTCKDAQKQ